MTDIWTEFDLIWILLVFKMSSGNKFEKNRNGEDLKGNEVN